MYDKGILHRDISFGNILICDDGGDDTRDAGMLVDLDHSKYSVATRTVPKHLGVTDQDRAALHYMVDLALWPAKLNVDYDVLSKILEINSRHSVAYLTDLCQTQPPGFSNTNDATTTVAVWTANALYWPKQAGLSVCPCYSV